MNSQSGVSHMARLIAPDLFRMIIIPNIGCCGDALAAAGGAFVLLPVRLNIGTVRRVAVALQTLQKVQQAQHCSIVSCKSCSLLQPATSCLAEAAETVWQSCTAAVQGNGSTSLHWLN
jgi:hypothetical protein